MADLICLETNVVVTRIANINPSVHLWYVHNYLQYCYSTLFLTGTVRTLIYLPVACVHVPRNLGICILRILKLRSDLEIA